MLSDVDLIVDGISAEPSTFTSFQRRVAHWMQDCFAGHGADDPVIRGDRFFEEALEYLQSLGYDFDRIPALVEYVRNRPPGEPSQEVGGVLVTLAASCNQAGIFMRQAAETEITRITDPQVMERIREKERGKLNIHGPLP